MSEITNLFGNVTGIIHDTEYSTVKRTVVAHPYLLYSSDILLFAHICRNMLKIYKGDTLQMPGDTYIEIIRNTYTEETTKGDLDLELRVKNTLVAKLIGKITLKDEKVIVMTKRAIVFYTLTEEQQLIVLNSISDLTCLFMEQLNEKFYNKKHSTSLCMTGTLNLPNSILSFDRE